MRFYLIIFAFLFTFVAPKVYAEVINQDAVDAFYLEREGEPLWINGSGLNRSGQDLLDVLKQAWMNGLNPSKYHVDEIENWKDSGKRNDYSLTAVEVLLTDGYAEYIRDLSGMRVDPKELGLDQRGWLYRISAQEALSYLKQHQDDIAEFMLMREPQTASYQGFKSELVKLVDNLADIEKNAAIKIDGVLRPGYGNSNVPALRQRFGISPPSQEARYTYDPILVSAVMDFQKENGLKPDGLIGKQTLHAINKTQLDKIDQLIVNLERLRWIPEEKPDRFIIVNIPSYTLWAVDHGKVAFEMPVIVGRKKRATPTFISEIHGVRFNPTWTVPKTIKREDIVPKLQENPNYLADKGMELYGGYNSDAPTLDPSVIDWNNIEEEELKNLRMVQAAGVNNPLGQVRVLMPNSYNVYLHDTNEKQDFARVNRSKSSGCVRMKDPQKVADFILKYRADWTQEMVDNFVGSKETQDIYVQEKMPVYMLYHTAWLGDKSRIMYGEDLYGYDKKLFQALQELDELPVLYHSE